MMVETKPFDEAAYLNSEEEIAGYLEAVAAESDPGAMVIALGIAARARNTAALAREVGISREGLYKSFAAGGNPSFATVRKVAQAMGYQVSFHRAPAVGEPVSAEIEAMIDTPAPPRKTRKARA